MSGWIRADPDHLSTSAIRVEQHAEEVQVGHTASDARIEAAQTGWTGTSAAAMTAKVAKWQADSAALHARLADHHAAFHGSAQAYTATEASNAEAIGDVGVAGAETAGSAET